MRKQTFTTIEKNATHDMVKQTIQGYPISFRMPGYLVQAFVYKRLDGMWSVTERTSGVMIAASRTRENAIKEATVRCEAAGAKQIVESIAGWMKYTKRHGITDGQPINPATTTDYTPRG